MAALSRLRAVVSAGAVGQAPGPRAGRLLPLYRPAAAEAPNGIIGLETALPLSLMQLVHSGRISLAHMIMLLSTNPARIIHQPLGRLQVGGHADITVFDPSFEWTYRAAEGRSKSRNSPFDGWHLKGAPTATIVAGNVVYRRV